MKVAAVVSFTAVLKHPRGWQMHRQGMRAPVQRVLIETQGTLLPPLVSKTAARRWCPKMSTPLQVLSSETLGESKRLSLQLQVIQFFLGRSVNLFPFKPQAA